VVEADAILVRAWRLAFGDGSDGGRAELESLLPALVAAGAQFLYGVRLATSLTVVLVLAATLTLLPAMLTLIRK
jgi:hypothetical protein